MGQSPLAVPAAGGCLHGQMKTGTGSGAEDTHVNVASKRAAWRMALAVVGVSSVLRYAPPPGDPDQEPRGR